MIVYEGPGRLVTLKEHDLPKGYAAGFEGLITLVNGLIPANEVIGQALRKTGGLADGAGSAPGAAVRGPQ
ncbi:MAG TPA: hypothetical protein VFK02_23055 [Kofleriaceae bacterium]|nr:hypothetical protein [Kofleriaceae bacterium]